MTDDNDGTAPDDDDRFGVTPEAIRAEAERHRGIIRSGMYVPTRGEVQSAPLSWLAPILLDWAWESPTLLIPTDDQIEAVIAILEVRPDAATEEMRGLIAELRGG